MKATTTEQSLAHSFAERIKFLRVKQGLTQRELAKRLGVSASWVGMYESGRRQPKYGTLKKLATALECDVIDLVSYAPTDDPNSHVMRFDSKGIHTTPASDALIDLKVEVDIREEDAERDGEAFPIDPEIKNQWVLSMIPETAKKYGIPEELLLENRPIYILSVAEQCKENMVDINDLPKILKRIVSMLDQMNVSGQQAAMQRLQEISEIPRYQTKKRQSNRKISLHNNNAKVSSNDFDSFQIGDKQPEIEASAVSTNEEINNP